MHDETRHAQLCFTLASRYAGQPLAPGPLSMNNVLARATLDDVAQLCLLEGCVGETLAALQAAEALAGATDADVRRALDSIAEEVVVPCVRRMLAEAGAGRARAEPLAQPRPDEAVGGRHG